MKKRLSIRLCVVLCTSGPGRVPDMRGVWPSGLLEGITMRRFILTLAAVCLISGASRGAPVINETFSGYLDNSLISDSPAGPAVGLTGDWSLVPVSDFYVNRTQGDLGAGTDKAVYDRPSDDNGTREATRSTSADHALFENDGDVFYASFLIDPPRSSGRMTFELRLKRLDGGGANDLSFGIIDGQYILGNGGADVDLGDGAVADGEQLVLVRIEYGDATSGPSDDEVVTLWVNPASQSDTPVIDGVSIDLLGRGGGKVTDISIRGEHMAGHPAAFDDLRVGMAFADVVPEPATMAILALGGLTMLRRRRRIT